MSENRELTEGAALRIMENYGNDPQQLIAVLLDIQAAAGGNYIDRKWAELVSSRLGVPLSKIFEVLTFYAMFSTEPRGSCLIEICQSAPCGFCGAQRVVEWFEAEAGVKMGQTTADGKITLARTSCVGVCDNGPVVKIGDNVYGSLNAEKVKTLGAHCRENNFQGADVCQN
jgi:NADH-quinone oxidoreductase subunit E